MKKSAKKKKQILPSVTHGWYRNMILGFVLGLIFAYYVNTTISWQKDSSFQNHPDLDSLPFDAPEGKQWVKYKGRGWELYDSSGGIPALPNLTILKETASRGPAS